MAVYRGALPSDNYTIVSNDWARDPSLTYKAKGLLLAISSHAEGYRLTVQQLIAQGRDGRDAVHAGLRELVDAGYMVVIQNRTDDGRLGEVDYRLTGKPGPAAPGTIIEGEEQARSRQRRTRSTPVPGNPDTATPDTADPTLRRTASKKTTPQKTNNPAAGATGDQLALDGAPVKAPRVYTVQEKAKGIGRSYVAWMTSDRLDGVEPPSPAKVRAQVEKLAIFALNAGGTEAEVLALFKELHDLDGGRSIPLDDRFVAAVKTKARGGKLAPVQGARGSDPKRIEKTWQERPAAAEVVERDIAEEFGVAPQA